MKRNKVVKLMAVVALVGAVGVGGSLALLQAQSETVTNTFVVGKGLHENDINLDEAEVNPETGVAVNPEKRVTTNTYKNLEQGIHVDKDPTVTIDTEAANCYVFALVDGIKDSPYYDVTIDSNWIKADRTDLNSGNKQLYVYSTDGKTPAVVAGGLSGESGLVFNGVKIKDDAPLYVENGESEDFEKANLPQIVVKACAVQSTGIDYQEALSKVKFN